MASPQPPFLPSLAYPQAIARNFILGPGAYLKDGWSWLDFLTTATGWVQHG